MTDSNFYSEIKAGEDYAWIGHKYTDRTMFGVIGNEQEWWAGMQTIPEAFDFMFDQLSTGKYERMWDILRIPLFQLNGGEYNLGHAPEVN
jgi:hypothetical protein